MIHWRKYKNTRTSLLLTMVLLSGCVFPAILSLDRCVFTDKITPRAATDSPVLVDGDNEWIFVPGITGDGSQGNPYVIKDKVIDAGGSGDCIRIQNTTKYFIIRNCTLTNAGAKPASNIYLWNVTNGILEQNNCSKTVGNGMLISYVANVTIAQNNVTECDYAIALMVCDNVSIVGNNASLCTTTGIQVAVNSTSIIVENNTVSINDFGIVFAQNSTLSVVRNNYVASHDFLGIYFYQSSNNSAIKNTVSGSAMGGIYLASNSRNNTIEGNLVTANSGEGIFLTGECKNNTILRNNLTFNTLHGIELQATCDGNLVDLNRFVQNTAGNGLDSGAFNTWDNGSRGNYWSNYAGVDDNDDGIGDTSWTVPGIAGSQDHYPIWRDTEHPIHIIGDDGWAIYRAADNCTGSGSSIDPYVITDLWYDAEGTTSGIWIENSTVHFIIQFCTANNSAAQPHSGIRLTNVTNGQVIQNDCSNNSGAGILAEKNCSSILIRSNRIGQNSYGIVLFQEGYNINITQNNVTRHFATGGAGISVASGPFINVTIAKNNVSNNDWVGINIWTPSANVSIYDNYVENHTGGAGGYGLRLMDVNTTYVWNNIFKGNTQGIYLQSGDTLCEFRTNNITGSMDGIYIGGCNLSKIEGNIITSNTRGIHWVQGNNNTIRGNKLTGSSSAAISFNPGGHNNSILWNNISNNQNGILWVFLSANALNNTIAFNFFAGNLLESVTLEATGCDSNWFFGNNFSSAPYVSDLGHWNRWDNGSFGNFWGDYAGADADDDFIGDTPYMVPSSGAQDNFPFCDDGDDVAPVVTITGLSVNQLCGGDAPSFGLTLVEAYTLEDTWVSYDNGLNNHTCGVGGTLPNWGDVGNGTKTVTFFANDTVGHEGQADITIRKDIEAPAFTSTGLTAGQLLGNITPAFVLAATEGNPSGLWWFSFDSGMTNTSCIQSDILAGWNLLPNGTVTIRFFTNDTMNNVGWIDISLERDCAPPIIFSTGLTAGASYKIAPTISLSIAEANRHAVWYSVEGGATNYTLASLTGTIDAAVWAGLPLGNVIVTFWSNDTLGNTASVMVVIVKASPTNECEGCGDTTLYWIIGIIAAGAAVGIGVVVKKRKKHPVYPEEVPATK